MLSWQPTILILFSSRIMKLYCSLFLLVTYLWLLFIIIIVIYFRPASWLVGMGRLCRPAVLANLIVPARISPTLPATHHQHPRSCMWALWKNAFRTVMSDNPPCSQLFSPLSCFSCLVHSASATICCSGPQVLMRTAS